MFRQGIDNLLELMKTKGYAIQEPAYRSLIKVSKLPTFFFRQFEVVVKYLLEFHVGILVLLELVLG